MKEIFSVKANQGRGPILFVWQKKHGNYLATGSTNDRSVHVFDRHGELIDEVSLPAECAGFDWDKDGTILAIINNKTPEIFLWDANNRRVNKLDSGFKDSLSLVLWSQIGSQLAVGTTKGNLLIYNHQTARKIPIIGKHTKQITSGCWGANNLLALCSEDRTISVSNADGDTLSQAPVRDVPSQPSFGEMKADERSNMGENTVSVVIGKKTLFLFNLEDPENPYELAFQNKYGGISNYEWYGDGYIMLGFSNGYMIVISTHLKEIGHEVHQTRNHKTYLSGIAITRSLKKAASIGDNTIQVRELADLKDVYAILEIGEEHNLERIAFSDDGQLLALSTSDGNLLVYLTQLPLIAASYQTRIAYLTSLLELTVQDQVMDLMSPRTFPLPVEPAFVGMGLNHLAAGMNNQAWFYFVDDLQSLEPIGKKEYLGTVQDIKLNAEYVAARFEGKIQLHLIEGNEDEGSSREREAKLFPDKMNKDCKITSHHLTPDFLVYATTKGDIHYFILEDWAVIDNFRHTCGIKSLFIDESTTRLVFIDDKNEAFVYNPVTDQTTPIEGFESTIHNILWEAYLPDKHIFVGYDDEKIYTFVYSPYSIHGPKCTLAGTTNLPYGQLPILLHNGQLSLQTTNGKLQVITLSTHPQMSQEQSMSQDEMRSALDQFIKLDKYKEAETLCLFLKDEAVWKKVALAALVTQEIEFAISVYRRISSAGMVRELEDIQKVENLNLRMGYIAMFLGETELAQDLFLQSNYPIAALQMRRDLLDWDSALHLAKSLAPDQIPFISKEFAQQLEFTGDWMSALSHFEKGVTKKAEFRDHDEVCAGGVARMSIRLGDMRRGVDIAMKLPNTAVKKDCAAILETLKQWAEAGHLYEKALCFDKAASCYIKAKNWVKVGDLLPKVSQPRIHLQYAKAKEAAKSFKEAAIAYGNARDFDNMVRINLDHLENPEEAVKVVNQSKSIEGAKMVARFFQKLNDFESAIQFLVMSKCNDEAFQLAQQHNQMTTYADIIGPDATPDDYRSIALHFESEGNHLFAGKFYFFATDYPKAMKHLLQCPESQEAEAMDYAIETIGRANSQQLTNQLIDFLMGGPDDIPKDAKYLFRLYMALKQYRDAAKTAVIIAEEEQKMGNYRVAHDVLYQMYCELRDHDIKIPQDMMTNLMLLHSYIIIKMQVKRGDHLKAARMLIRVANHISKFPAHVVNILTSTVIECHKAGLKNSAFNYAAMLMRPEYRSDVDPKYRSKIEHLVRKPDRSEVDEEQTPCPHCDQPLVETLLTCTQCQNNIPFCIATGRHVVKEELSLCSSCNFPAIHSELIRLLQTESTCPMCSQPLMSENVTRVSDVDAFFQDWQN